MQKVTIIAEAGVNHNGNLRQALDLVDIAVDAGTDIIKFQTFKTERVVTKKAKIANYQTKNSADGEDKQYSMLKKLELDDEMHHEIIHCCKQKQIQFLSTGFDEESIDFLDKLGISLFKIPSGEITNKPYLQHISRKGKPVILSTGMSNLKEIENALTILTNEGLSKDFVTILHCNTEYPTPMRDVNLKAMLTIKEAFDIKVGLSDHTLGIEVPIAAVALGATVIEKHFTLDRSLPGPDHTASLEPRELKEMVNSIRNIEEALSGSGIKEPTPSETPNIQVVRRSIHYSRYLTKGHIINDRDIIMKRPGDGISPMEYEKCLSKRLRSNVSEDQQLKWEDLE